MLRGHYIGRHGLPFRLQAQERQKAAAEQSLLCPTAASINALMSGNTQDAHPQELVLVYFLTANSGVETR